MNRREEWQAMRQRFQDELDEFNAMLDAVDTGTGGYAERDYFQADVRVRESFRKYTSAMRNLFGPSPDK